jgi:ABC-2 type transport system permease protein
MKVWNKKSFKYGSYAFIATAVVIAIVVILNGILGFDTIRDRLRFDITKNRRFSLGEQSIEIIKNLKKDVEIIILTEEKNFQLPDVVEILKQYTLKSNGKIKLKFVDAEKDPLYIQRELDPDMVKGIKAESIVVKSGTKSKVIAEQDMIEYDYVYGFPQAVGYKIEQAFTSAINSVVAEKTSVLYFVKGHGEIPLDNLTDLKASIASNNFEVKELMLNQEVPGDADVLFFVSPKSDLLKEETENMMTYLEAGGDAVFLMSVQTTDEEMPNFDMIYDRYSLKLNNDIVMEGDQNWYYNDFNIIRPQVLENQVTTNLDPNSLFLLMPNCRSIDIKQINREWITARPLFITSEKSQSQDLITGDNNPGPFILGALSEYTSTRTSKIALIGNAEFISDVWMRGTVDNGSRYILSILDWMIDQEQPVYIPARNMASQPITLTQQSRFVAFIVLTFIVPLAIIGTGLFVWIRRKHL